MASNTEVDELDELQIARMKLTADMKHDPEPNFSEPANESDIDGFSEYEEGKKCFVLVFSDNPLPTWIKLRMTVILFAQTHCRNIIGVLLQLFVS